MSAPEVFLRRRVDLVIVHAQDRSSPAPRTASDRDEDIFNRALRSMTGAPQTNRWTGVPMTSGERVPHHDWSVPMLWD